MKIMYKNVIDELSETVKNSGIFIDSLGDVIYNKRFKSLKSMNEYEEYVEIPQSEYRIKAVKA